ncbi:CrpP-related protein [Achromobacter insolitus]|uniref:CrpP-related protein n=1 Tax=Achromobacter insolitus TaxID=217204 RepID=UPI00398940B9
MDELARKAGQEAARYGAPLSACPFLKAANMPGHTGESHRAWRDKLFSWEEGWQLETNARRTEAQNRKTRDASS